VLPLIILMDYWVIRPITRMINISNKVSSGIYSSRLPTYKSQIFQDEFDILYKTFNGMLDSTEKNIEQTKTFKS
jgi:nitrate/nitrite-specific signal transduction histidine kinase